MIFHFLIAISGTTIAALPPMPPKSEFSDAAIVEIVHDATVAASNDSAPVVSQQASSETLRRIALSRRKHAREIDRKYFAPANYLWEHRKMAPQDIFEMTVDAAKPTTSGRGEMPPTTLRQKYETDLADAKTQLTVSIDQLRAAYIRDRNALVDAYSSLQKQRTEIENRLQTASINATDARNAAVRTRNALELQLAEVKRNLEQLKVEYACPVSGVEFEQCTNPDHQHFKAAFLHKRASLNEQLAYLETSIQKTRTILADSDVAGDEYEKLQQDALNSKNAIASEFVKYEKARVELSRLRSLHSHLCNELKRMESNPARVIGEWWGESEEFDDLEFSGKAVEGSQPLSGQSANPFKLPGVKSENPFLP